MYHTLRPAYATWRLVKAPWRSRAGSPSTSGRSAATASIAVLAWPRSPLSSLANASEASVEIEATRNCWTSNSRICSKSACASRSGSGFSDSATDPLPDPYLLRVDLPQRGAVGDARELLLGGVLGRDGEERRRPDLLGDRLQPVHELLEALPGRD